jgi:hypothetical protein
VHIGDRGFYSQSETSPTVGKLDTIARQQEMIKIPLVMEADSSDDSTKRQIAGDIHQRVAITSNRPLLFKQFEQRRTNPPENKWAVTHCLYEPENFARLARKTPPDLRA